MNKDLLEKWLAALEHTSGFPLADIRVEQMESGRHLFSAIYSPAPGGELRLQLMLDEKSLNAQFDDWVASISASMERAAEAAIKAMES